MALPKTDDELEKFMESHGWAVWDTGGGCQNWGKEFPDGNVALIGPSDSGITVLTTKDFQEAIGLSCTDKSGNLLFEEEWPTFEKFLNDLDGGIVSDKGLTIAGTRRAHLIAELKAKGITVTPDGKVAKADIVKVLAEEDLKMSGDEYNSVLQHIKKMYDATDGLKNYLLTLLDKGDAEKDKLLHEMIDATIAQRKSIDGFYKNFNK